MKIILSNTRINIRPMTIDDLQAFLDIRNECRESLHNNTEFGFEDVYKWWTAGSGGSIYFIIEGHDGMLGYVRTSKWNSSARSVYVGIDIASKHRRKGYAAEAYHIMLDHLFCYHRKNKVGLEVLSNNSGAIALYEKLGFKHDGVNRCAIKRGNIYIDALYMSILAEEWSVKVSPSTQSALKES